MRHNRFRLLTANHAFVFFLFLLLTMLLSPFSESQVYKITTIPTLGGQANFNYPNIVVAINNAGQTLGTSSTATAQTEKHVGLWTPGVGIQDLGGPLEIGALNNLGHVAGTGPNGEGFLWTPSAGFQYFGTSGFTVTHLNDLDQITGSLFSSATGNMHAFLWTPGMPPELQDLGTLAPPGNFYSQGYGVNNLGQVVGVSQTGNKGKAVGFIWSNGSGMQATTLATAIGINNNGQVLGSITAHSSLNGHAALWTQTGGNHDLGLLPGGTYSFAIAINNHGFVAGDADGADGKLYIYLWSQATGMVDINTLVKRPGQSLGVIGMNDAGQIAAAGNDGKAYLLTPIIALTDSSSKNPSTLGQPVTFRATANSIIGPPPDGEIITFKASGVVIGSAPVVNGTATFTTSSLKVGSHTFSVTYPGDVNYASSKSKVSTQVVTK